jgi:hypothetical protein
MSRLDGELLLKCSISNDSAATELMVVAPAAAAAAAADVTELLVAAAAAATATAGSPECVLAANGHRSPKPNKNTPIKTNSLRMLPDGDRLDLDEINIYLL